jgi:hypothetical protein
MLGHSVQQKARGRVTIVPSQWELVFQERASFRESLVGSVEMKWTVTLVWSVPAFEVH